MQNGITHLSQASTRKYGYILICNLYISYAKPPLMKQALIYSLKVWLTTVALSSLISIQTAILNPHYHLSTAYNPFYDWILQLCGTSFVNIILLLPMGIILSTVAITLRKRNVRLKIRLYTTVIIFCIIPSLGLMCYEIKTGLLTLTSVAGIGMVINTLTCTLVALVSVRHFELFLVSSKA